MKIGGSEAQSHAYWSCKQVGGGGRGGSGVGAERGKEVKWGERKKGGAAHVGSEPAAEHRPGKG
jgi:hypothetical protein